MNENAGTRILVVEDDTLFRAVLEKRLGLDGYDVHVAADGREGMKAIVAEEPDLVLSDWMMPHVDGLELCQSIKTGLKDKAPYFILLTAKGQVSDRLLALQTGADDYLMKPCDMGEILARVRMGVRIIRAGHDLLRMDREVKNLRRQRDERERQLQQLASLMPACPHCGRVQTGTGEWEELAKYLERAQSPGTAHQACEDCTHRNQRVA